MVEPNPKKPGLLGWTLALVLGTVGLLGNWGLSGTPKEPDPSEVAGHELREANSKGLLIFGIALMAGAVLLQFTLTSIFFALKRQSTGKGLLSSEPASGLKSDPALFAGREHLATSIPRLQSAPVLDLKTYLDREERLLNSYGWVDQPKAIAHLPIQRAMEILVTQSNASSAEKEGQ